MKSLYFLLLTLVAILIVPSLASAQSFILDTGVPTGSSLFVLNSSYSFAAEFSATAGEDITQLSAYLTQTAEESGTGFTFAIYSSPLRSRSLSYIDPIDTYQATFSANGWNSVAVNYTIPTTGDYWVAIQGNGGTFDVPNETSATTGTVPALAFAYASSDDYYTVNSSDSVGLEVTATPEPSAWALALLGVGGFVYLRRRAVRA